MQPLHLVVLLGTGRKDRFSEKVAAYLRARLAARADFAVTHVDVRDIAAPLTTPPWEPNDAVKPWRDAMAAADALLVISPEYNRGYPGELKIAIDALQKEYRRKPVALAGVSSGIFGGTRVIHALRLVFVYLGMVPISAEMNFGNVESLFAADGAITDAAYDKRINGALDELAWLAGALKAARETPAA